MDINKMELLESYAKISAIQLANLDNEEIYSKCERILKQIEKTLDDIRNGDIKITE